MKIVFKGPEPTHEVSFLGEAGRSITFIKDVPLTVLKEDEAFARAYLLKDVDRFAEVPDAKKKGAGEGE